MAALNKCFTVQTNPNCRLRKVRHTNAALVEVPLELFTIVLKQCRVVSN